MNTGIKRSVISGIVGVSFFLMSVTAAAQTTLLAYTGKYKRDVNGYQAYVDVFIKDHKLRAKQSWDGKTRTFEYVGDNKFIIAMDGWAIKFIRNKANKVIQMQVLGNEVWMKI
jgi:hypothetical protein